MSRGVVTGARGGFRATKPLAREAPPADEIAQRAVVVVDRELRVVAATQAARVLLGRRLRAGDRLGGGGGHADLAAAARQLLDAPQIDDVLVVDGGRALRVTAVPPSASGDNLVLVLADVLDVARGGRLERDFVANASHELRTPLATINGAIEILQAGAKEVPEARDRFLAHIEREARRLGRLVVTLLTLARVQAGHELPDLGPVAVQPVLEEAAAAITPPPGVDVIVSCPPELTVVAHPDLLHEIVANLSSNAAKYTERGRIVLAAAAAAAADGDGGTASLEVSDTGRGIAPELQDRLFGRFYRGDDDRTEGFGLGLAIVREAVSALGGGIEIDSAPGRGTIVRVTLPQAREEAAS